MKLNCDIPNKEIYLKLENLQSVGSFKVRGAYNALINLTEEDSKNGVHTSSIGNFAHGLAWCANMLNIPFSVIIPIGVSKVKINAVQNFGCKVIEIDYDDWWNVIMTGKYNDMDGVFIHPSCDENVMAGNGVIGLEIIDMVPDVDTIICPYGGGGNSVGIASAVKQCHPNVKVYACEVETATPLSTSFKAGKPVVLERFKKSFVEGMNGRAMVPCMWNLATNLITGSVVTTLREICDALKMLALKNHIIAEGAGAATVAAAMSAEIPDGKIVCVVSGGNIDLETLNIILQGDVPDLST